MDDEKRLIALLNDQHRWPGTYQFKFIVKSEDADQLRDFFSQDEFLEKKSSAGNYLSITVIKYFQQAEEVMQVYQEVRKMKGVISL